MTAQEESRRKVLEHVRAARHRRRVAASAGGMPNFEIGEYVLMARVRSRAVLQSWRRHGLDRGMWFQAGLLMCTTCRTL